MANRPMKTLENPKRQAIRDPLHQTAVHEAGHCVAALANGVEEVYAYLPPGGSSRGVTVQMIPDYLHYASDVIAQISAAGELAVLFYREPDLTVDSAMERYYSGRLQFNASDAASLPTSDFELRLAFEAVLFTFFCESRALKAIADHLRENYAAGVGIIQELWHRHRSGLH
jgi:hypothetical protein